MQKMYALMVDSTFEFEDWTEDFNNQNSQVDELDTSDSNTGYLKNINMLNKEQNILLNIVFKMNSLELKKQYMEHVVRTLVNDQPPKPIELPLISTSCYDLIVILYMKKQNKKS